MPDGQGSTGSSGKILDFLDLTSRRSLSAHHAEHYSTVGKLLVLLLFCDSDTSP